jgi:hypothetical protein
VTQAAQGPVDSVVTDARGRFRFRLAADTTGLHLLSARHAGIEYFSQPVDVGPESGDRPVTLVVHDTSSTAPVGVAARHVVVPRVGEDGTREVLDLVLLANAGALTRVAPDSESASWAGPLPPQSEGLDVGESDVSPDAVMRRGDSVIVSAPISPGEKQLAFQYHLPPGRREIEIPVGGAPLALNLLLEEPGARVSGATMVLADSQLIEGRAFQRWTGDLPANAVVRLHLPATGTQSTAVLFAMVGLLAGTLLLAAWRLMPRARKVSVDGLIDEIATLDARYQGRESEIASEEWARYLRRRGILKTELEAALARESAGR